MEPYDEFKISYCNPVVHAQQDYNN
jgi:hypothetical protein